MKSNTAASQPNVTVEANKKLEDLQESDPEIVEINVVTVEPVIERPLILDGRFFSAGGF